MIGMTGRVGSSHGMRTIMEIVLTSNKTISNNIYSSIRTNNSNILKTIKYKELIIRTAC